MSFSTARRAAAVATALGSLGAAYWTMFSSYSQLLGPFPYRAAGDPGGPGLDRRIALTFDDGPNEPYTSELADFLAEHSIRATFFQVGECVRRHPEVSRRLLRDGHVIGNHSASHRFGRCWGIGSQRRQTAGAQEALVGVLGRRPALYRPPWLLRTPTLRTVLREQRLSPVSGEFCHSLEVFQPSAARIARGALAKAKPGAILIFHDGFDARGGNRASTVGAVRIVVADLLRQGYQFCTVDELLGLPAYQD